MREACPSAGRWRIWTDRALVQWWIYSIKVTYSWIWLIWGDTLAGSTCRVKGVKIGR